MRKVIDGENLVQYTVGLDPHFLFGLNGLVGYVWFGLVGYVGLGYCLFIYFFKPSFTDWLW